jgi:large subunit ribosomal protein L6
MSRIGLKPILIPDKVKVALEGGRVKIEGPKGKAAFELPEPIRAEIKDKSLVLVNSEAVKNRYNKALHGLSRSVIAAHIEGTVNGFKKELEIHGVGFKAAVQGKNLVLNIGYSHQVFYPIPEGIKVTVNDNVNIVVEGADKQLVGAVAADIRAQRPPEPFKGKGIRYKGEHIRRKEGKTAQSK